MMFLHHRHRRTHSLRNRTPPKDDHDTPNCIATVVLSFLYFLLLMEGCLTIKVWSAGWGGKTCGSFGFLNLVLYFGCIGRRSSDLLFLFFSLPLLGWNRNGYWNIWGYGRARGGKRTPLSFFLLFYKLFWVRANEVEEDISPGVGTGIGKI